MSYFASLNMPKFGVTRGRGMTRFAVDFYLYVLLPLSTYMLNQHFSIIHMPSADGAHSSYFYHRHLPSWEMAIISSYLYHRIYLFFDKCQSPNCISLKNFEFMLLSC